MKSYCLGCRASVSGDGKVLEIQLILKQQGFVLCGSTYIQIFSIVDTIVLHDPQLVEQ